MENFFFDEAQDFELAQTAASEPINHSQWALRLPGCFIVWL